MQFKIDENLLIEIVELLINAGHDAKTVNEQTVSCSLRAGKGKMRNNLVLLFVILIVCLFGYDVKAESDKAAEQAALRVANEWLQLVDNTKYDESWNSAAEFFKSAVVRDSWRQTLQAFRSPLGKIISRKVKSKKFTTSLPEAPDGQYVVIQYEASFENKKSAIETVTPMLDKDGKWRVSGYYIK